MWDLSITSTVSTETTATTRAPSWSWFVRSMESGSDLLRDLPLPPLSFSVLRTKAFFRLAGAAGRAAGGCWMTRCSVNPQLPWRSYITSHSVQRSPLSPLGTGFGIHTVKGREYRFFADVMAPLKATWAELDYETSQTWQRPWLFSQVEVIWLGFLSLSLYNHALELCRNWSKHREKYILHNNQYIVTFNVNTCKFDIYR